MPDSFSERSATSEESVYALLWASIRMAMQKQANEQRNQSDLVQVRKPDKRRWCTERMLNFRSLKKAVDIRAQLAQHLKQLKVCHPYRPLLAFGMIRLRGASSQVSMSCRFHWSAAGRTQRPYSAPCCQAYLSTQPSFFPTVSPRY